jgi:tetratricopeptide (TPR) repeat protein
VAPTHPLWPRARWFVPCGRRVLASVLLSALLVVAVGGSARAEGGRDYERAIEAAVAAYNDGDYAEAARQFQRAHELSPSARTLRGQGMSELELGHHERAAEALVGALASTVAPLEGELRVDTERLLQQARARVGTLRLQVDPPTSELMLDGVHRQLDPERALFVAAGSHLIELQAPGHEPARQPITAEAGRELAVKLALAPSRPHEEQRAWAKSPWLWTGVGVLVIGAVVGGLVLRSHHAQDESRSPSTTGYTFVLSKPTASLR